MDVKELIQNIEGNFSKYDQLLGEKEQGENTLEGLLDTNPQVRELVHRASDIQDEVVDYRLKKILNEERPYIPSIRPDKLHKRPGSTARSIVKHFLKQRQELVKLLHSLPVEYWERTGVHEKEGHVSFKEFIRRMAEKDGELLTKLSNVLRKPNLS